jgi:hypothetical protein
MTMFIIIVITFPRPKYVPSFPLDCRLRLETKSYFSKSTQMCIFCFPRTSEFRWRNELLLTYPGYVQLN